MQTRVAVMAVIVEKSESVEKLNSVLHEYGNFIIGRMGIPYKERRINILSRNCRTAGHYIVYRRKARKHTRSKRQNRLLKCDCR